MDLGQNFVMSQLPENGDANQDSMPAGRYVAEITQAEVKDTKAGTGKYISLSLTIAQGEHAGRLVWTNINIQNPSAAAVRRGLADLRKLGEALGLQSMNNTSVLVTRMVGIELSQEQVAEGAYGADANGYRNEVKGYLPAPPQAAPAAAAVPQHPQYQQPPAAPAQQAAPAQPQAQFAPPPAQQPPAQQQWGATQPAPTADNAIPFDQGVPF